MCDCCCAFIHSQLSVACYPCCLSMLLCDNQRRNVQDSCLTRGVAQGVKVSEASLGVK